LERYRFAVVGRGLIGSAAARHLARESEGVLVVGPDEPNDKARHHGVFGSHYDEGRITRVLDQDETWARLARASIARYGEIEEASGIRFYTEAGLLSAAPGPEGSAYVDRLGAVALRLNVAAERLEADDLAKAFPQLRFYPRTVGIRQEHDAGHVSPRRLVAAQTAAAERAGATVIRDEVLDLYESGSGVEIRTRGGSELRAERVVVAAGGYTALGGMIHHQLGWTVQGRVVAMFDVDDGQREAIGAMPSIIYARPWEGQAVSTYLLPPIEYPDGRHYVKIGSGTFPRPLESAVAAGRWFREPDGDDILNALHAIARELIPALEGAPTSYQTCMTTHTATGRPYIGELSRRVFVAAGGNGSAAKSSDEIGRLAALRLLDAAWPEEYDPAAFTPVFA
jgi:sarcosine oxidase